MNRSLFKRVFPQVMAFVVAFALSGVLAAAQDAAPAGQRTDGQIATLIDNAAPQLPTFPPTFVSGICPQDEEQTQGRAGGRDRWWSGEAPDAS